MSSNTEKTDRESSRKRYETPRIVESARFETLAAGCGSTPGGPGGCGFSPSLS